MNGADKTFLASCRSLHCQYIPDPALILALMLHMIPSWRSGPLFWSFLIQYFGDSNTPPSSLLSSLFSAYTNLPPDERSSICHFKMQRLAHDQNIFLHVWSWHFFHITSSFKVWNAVKENWLPPSVLLIFWITLLSDYINPWPGWCWFFSTLMELQNWL